MRKEALLWVKFQKKKNGFGSTIQVPKTLENKGDIRTYEIRNRN
jgi:hypothetical protein